MRFSRALCCSVAACSWLAAEPASAQAAASDAGGSWALALGGQADESSSDAVFATINWGVKPQTWLMFSAGRSTSPADLADVQADTLLAGIDQRFDTVGFTLQLGHWGDEAALTTDDVRGSVYFDRPRWRLGLAYTARDIEIPFSVTGPLGNTVHRRADLSGDSFAVDARLRLGERSRLYLGAAEYDYDRDLNLIPRIDRLNLLSTSTLTLANGFIDHERSIGVEQELGRTVLNVRFTTDRSALDDSKFETLDVALLLPAGSRMDIEINVGRGRSTLVDAGFYGGVMLLLYGR